MMHRRLTLTALVWALLASLAFGQYAPNEVASREFQNAVLAIGEQVKAQNPRAWQNAHNGSEPSGSEFVRRWALALRSAGYTVCVNGKRGGDTLSQDVLVFPVTSGAAQDTSGRYAGRIVIADVIAGAGGSSPSLTFSDVSQFAPGKCIDPVLEAGEGATPPPQPGTGTPPPPVVTPPTTGYLLPIIEALQRIEANQTRLQADVDALKGRQADIDTIRQTMNELVLGSEVMGYVRLQNQAIHDDLEQMRATLQAIARSPLLRLGR